MNRNIALIVGGIALAVLAVCLLVGWDATTEPRDDGANLNLEEIRSFEDCAAAGLPVMESYPRQCNTPDGRNFAEEIEIVPTYTNASSDMIVVELPYPGAVVAKEFVVVGEARGNWFFEASFPIEVLDMDGNTIAGSFATAEGEWMTTDFVSFKSELIDLPSAYTGPATLVLRKDNPSGLPENDASVSFPIVVEY
jgi:hypothetical protein